jgi:hypothetical protein
MADDNPKIGLEAVLNLETFSNAMQSYMNGIGTMDNTTEKVAADMSSNMTASAMAMAVAVGNIAAKAFEYLTDKIKDFVVGGVQAAMIDQQMDYAMQLMANNTGIAGDAIEATAKSVEDLGFSSEGARTALIALMRANVDTTKATELAKMAQDAAALSNTSSEDALGRLTLAVQRHSTYALRSLGITVDTTEAYKEYAKAHNTTTEAMIDQQKSAAMLNAILEKGKSIAGAYAAVMATPGEQLKLFKTNMDELVSTVGSFFLPAFGKITTVMLDISAKFRKAVEEGGPLYNVLVQIGAYAEYFAEVIGNAATAVADFILGFGTGDSQQKIINFFSNLGIDVTGILKQLASDAGTWGVNIVEQLANGMIQGAVAVLNALASIGNMITSWLSPGSPPKLLPDLDKWGASAIDVYLSGWKNADFSVFDDLSSSLTAVFRSMDISEKNMIPDILAMRNAVAGAVEGIRSGQMTIAQATEIVGNTMKGAKDQVTDYVNALFQETKAESDLKAAQDNLNAVTDAYDKKLSGLYAQLNALNEAANTEADTQRIGAIDKAIATGMLTVEEKKRLLAEKNQILLRQQITDTEKARSIAVSDAEIKVKAAADAKAAADEQLNSAKAMMDIQTETNSLMKQQVDLLKRLADQAAAAAKAAAGTAAGAGGDGGKGAGTGLNITDAMKKAIEDAKTKISAKIAEMVAAWKAKFDEKMKPIIDAWEDVKKAWTPVFEDLKKLWDETLKPALDDFFKFLTDNWQSILIVAVAVGLLIGVMWLLSTAVSAVASAFLVLEGIAAAPALIAGGAILIGLFGAIAWGLAAAIVGLTLFVLAWTNNWGDIQGKTKAVWDFLVDIFGKFAFWLNVTLPKAVEDFVANIGIKWYVFRMNTDTEWKLLKQAIIDAYNAAEAWVEEKVALFQASINTWWQTMVIDAGKEWENLKTGISTAIDGAVKYVTDAINGPTGLLVTLGGYWTSFYNVGRDIVLGMKQGVIDFMQNLIDSVVAAIKAAIEAAKKWLDERSPSGVFRAIGMNTMLGMAEGIEKYAKIPALASAKAASSMATSYRTNTTNIYNQKTIQMYMNPNYQQMQSPASIYYDVSVALAAVR